ncbi:MAG: hypothetical protein LQ343_007733 [Gyalolechia ehrenbergii]|nr:MAG: hypothetical protein LQ343_007733 [Gyalolechia ehrenbergii]
MALSSCLRDGTYHGDIRLIGKTESSKLQSLSQIVQHSDPVAVIEVRLEAIDLNTVNTVDNDTVGCARDNSPKPNCSDVLSSSSIPMDQLATKDDIAFIDKGIQSDRKVTQSNVNQLLYLADAIGQVVHDKAVDLNDVQQSIHEHEGQLLEHRVQLADILPRVSDLEAAQSRTNTETSTYNHTHEEMRKTFARQMQRMRRGIKGVKTRALVEARGTKRKFDQMSDKMSQIDQRSKADAGAARIDTRDLQSDQENMKTDIQGITSGQEKMTTDISNIRSDQTQMQACLEQAWVAAGQEIADFVTQQMDQFSQQYEVDKQAIAGFHRQYGADKQAIEGFLRQCAADQQSVGSDMKTLETDLTNNLVAATDRLRDRQDTLQAEFQRAAEESRTSRSLSGQQSNGDVSNQPTTDVPVVHVEPEAIQERHELAANQAGPSSNVHDQTFPTAEGTVRYPRLPNINAGSTGSEAGSTANMPASSTAPGIVRYPPLPAVNVPPIGNMEGGVAGSSDACDDSLSWIDEVERQYGGKRRRQASPAHPGFRRCQTRLQGGRCSGLTERAEGEAEDARVWFCGRCVDVRCL